LPQEGIYSPSLQSTRQRVFVKNEFHHLNVETVETVDVWDIFDCAFECVRNSLCFSVNLAASKAPDGKRWCELLSSDKYRDPAEYKANISAHHYYIEVKKVFSALACFQYYSSVRASPPRSQTFFSPRSERRKEEKAGPGHKVYFLWSCMFLKGSTC